MAKMLWLAVLISFLCGITNAQSLNEDSIRRVLSHSNADTSKVMTLTELAWLYTWSRPDSAIKYGLEARRLAIQLSFKRGEIRANGVLVEALGMRGNFAPALDIALNSLQLAEKTSDKQDEFTALFHLSALYFYMEDYDKALPGFLKLRDGSRMSLLVKYALVGETYFHLNRLDSAKYYMTKSYQLNLATRNWPIPYIYMAAIQAKDHNYNEAFANYRKAIVYAKQQGIEADVLKGTSWTAVLMKQLGQHDSAIFYAKQVVDIAQRENLIPFLADAAGLLTELYTPRNSDSAFKYLKIVLGAKDSLFSQDKTKQLQSLSINEVLRRQEAQYEEMQFVSTLKIYILVAIAALFAVVMFFLFRTNRYKQKAYTLLEQQKRDIELQNARDQLEAALERLRLSALAMHTSNDIGNTAAVLFVELSRMGISTIRCGISVIDDDKKMARVWATFMSPDGEIQSVSGRLDVSIHPMLEAMYEAAVKQHQDFSYILEGDDIIHYYEAIGSSPGYKVTPFRRSNVKHYVNAFAAQGVCSVFTFTTQPLSEESHKTLKKFATVFGLAYRRYYDLKLAEEQTQEAIRQAVLDKVRAEIASMRSSDDLQHITPLIWQQLKMLQVPFIRCGVFILDESAKHVQLYLSSPDGHSLGVLNLSVEDTELTRRTVEHWRQGTVYMLHWNREDFLNWTETMMRIGQVQDGQAYTGNETPPESLHLHMVPFKQGMLYVGNSERLTDDQLQSVKLLADAFDIAFARYMDFKKLEVAKKEADKAYQELKQTQAQLIQAEKMASLGELTAGIAHEIQNPLNFINNFAEVSGELAGELTTEINAGNIDVAKLISSDLNENMNKIVFHGRRADSIVKNMLQHSRHRSGGKEPTDINSLVDEYLRLSYHGLRAKDKSFNARMETQLSTALGNINVVPQDIGRVLLNLFNNAFYSIAQKKAKFNGAYDPVVHVSTKQEDNMLKITVRDNGIGIPKHIIDKIYQPFFTTKPTSEGTGLGLSMCYEIITKVHGGTIKVHTEEMEFAEFEIILPLKD